MGPPLAKRPRLSSTASQHSADAVGRKLAELRGKRSEARAIVDSIDEEVIRASIITESVQALAAQAREHSESISPPVGPTLYDFSFTRAKHLDCVDGTTRVITYTPAAAADGTKVTVQGASDTERLVCKYSDRGCSKSFANKSGVGSHALFCDFRKVTQKTICVGGSSKSVGICLLSLSKITTARRESTPARPRSPH